MQVLLLISLVAAQGALQDFDAACRAENGRLWGRSLCGPVVLADPQTREAVASADGKVFEAKIPQSIGIANTSVEWDGRAWTMVMWPLPDDPLARRRLIAHESFHRVQKELGFPSTGPANAHLDSADGRYWLRLEWRALAEALKTRNKRAVEDALAFRARRHALAQNAAEEERLLEMHEGLAEHTGFAVAQPQLAARAKSIAEALARAESGDSLVRSFAYASGPAWGALIEMRDPKWTRSLKPADDLARLARTKWRAKEAAGREARYGHADVRAEEDARAKRKAEERAVLRAKFVDGPILTLPLAKMQLVFDPHGLQPLDDLGTVYRKIEITDAWGKIVVTDGGMITSDWKRLIVPADGKGWTLTLNEGWRVANGTVIKDR